MRYLLLFLLIAAAGDAPAGAERQTQANKNNTLSKQASSNGDYHPEWFKQSFLDLKDDIQEAGRQNKKLIVYFYQHGCPYCKKLIKYNLADKTALTLAKNNFDIIAINIFGALEVTDTDDEVLSEKQYSKKMHISFTPTMIVFNEKNQAIFKMHGYYALDKFTAMLKYLTEKNRQQQTFSEYLKTQARQAKQP